jgi:hypothetical protein
MQEIGDEFVRLRSDSRAGAWSSLQKKLMENMGLLVPAATSMKDFLALNMAIEDFLKTEQGASSLHPTEALAAFLNEGAPNAMTVPPPIPSTTDEEDDSESDDDADLPTERLQ